MSYISVSGFHVCEIHGKCHWDSTDSLVINNDIVETEPLTTEGKFHLE